MKINQFAYKKKLMERGSARRAFATWLIVVLVCGILVVVGLK
jgi:hypothetical protein